MSIHYTADDLLNLTPGLSIQITVSQEDIDLATPGDKRNCAFVRAIFRACEAVYRAEVDGNHVYIWIDKTDEKWKVWFYMTLEVWELATQFDKERTDTKPAMIPICFHKGECVNRQQSRSSRKVNKFKPIVELPIQLTAESTTQSTTKLPAQITELLISSPNSNGDKQEPIVKPINVPGQRAEIAKAKSRWVRDEYYTHRRAS